MAALGLARGGRIVGTGVAALAVVGAVYALVSAHRSTEAVAEALAAKESKLVKYREKLLEKEAVSAELAAVRSALKQAEAGLLTGETPSLAAAEVQEIVTSVANAAGGQIKTVRVLPPEPLRRQSFLAIPVEVTLHSSMRELTQLLYRLDGSAKLLRISKMEIKPLGRQARRGATPETLSTTLTVEGFARRAGERG